MADKGEKLKALLEFLKVTRDDEIDCDEFWNKSSWLAEQKVPLSLETLATYLHHLQLCPDCAEEYDLLKECLEFDEQNVKNLEDGKTCDH